MTWLIHDYEVQNKEYFGSIASPHNPENYIVATGWCIDNNPVQSLYFNTKEEALKSNWFEEALKGQKVYVAHNATFEIQWNLKCYGKVFLDWLAQGGKVWCTQLAEYILERQQELYPNLEDCAVKHGGTRKVDAVKVLWESGVTTAEIDQALLMDYLADDEHGDVANTRRVCFNQYRIAKERDMLPMMWERMDALLFNAVATYNGLYVDTDVAATNQAEQEQRISEIREVIMKSLPDDLPDDLEFSFTSPYHMSAFLYGGTIKYKAKVSYEPKKYEQVEVYWDELHDEPLDISHYNSLDSYVKNCYTPTVYKAGKNKGLPKVFKINSDVEKLKWGDKEFKFDGLIDLESLPTLVKEQFLGKRAEFRGARDLVCGTPVYSTGKDALDVLAIHNVPEAVLLKELAALEKDTGTYYLRTDANGKQSGMLQFVEPDGIVHHQLNACSTVTGRLSGTKPNMQNIPRDGTSKVKEMFTSRFGSDGRIVEVDYSALEVVVLAAISGDNNLMQQLIDGTDMHCYRLAGMLGEPYDEVFTKCHDKSHPDHKRYKQLRTDVKPRAFANQYGASAHGIAFATGCTVEEAEAFKATEAQLFPESSTYADRIVRPEVERTGLELPYERELNERGEWKIYRRGYFRAKSGTEYSFRQYPKMIEGREVYDYKPTQLANYWCQGEASFIVQAACGRVLRELIKHNFVDWTVLPITTTHDSIYLDCANEALAVEYGRLVRDIMESTPKYLCDVIPELRDWNYHTTPFPAASEMGASMMNKVDID